MDAPLAAVAVCKAGVQGLAALIPTSASITFWLPLEAPRRGRWTGSLRIHGGVKQRRAGTLGGWLPKRATASSWHGRWEAAPAATWWCQPTLSERRSSMRRCDILQYFRLAFGNLSALPGAAHPAHVKGSAAVAASCGCCGLELCTAHLYAMQHRPSVPGQPAAVAAAAPLAAANRRPIFVY